MTPRRKVEQLGRFTVTEHLRPAGYLLRIPSSPSLSNRTNAAAHLLAEFGRDRARP
jgi:hypothetical protein